MGNRDEPTNKPLNMTQSSDPIWFEAFQSSVLSPASVSNEFSFLAQNLIVWVEY